MAVAKTRSRHGNRQAGELVRIIFYVLCSVLCVLWSGCISSPSTPKRPPNANIQITRPTSTAKVIAGTQVTIRSGRVPMLAMKDGETRFGVLEPGKYILTAVSVDPYNFSEYSASTWSSAPFELLIEKDKNYSLEVIPGPETGWIIRQVQEE